MAKGRAFAKPLKATRTEFEGVVYDSKSEAARAQALAALRAQGQVSVVLRQVKCDIGEPGVDQPYRVDFLVFKRLANSAYEVWAEDVKGCDSPTWRRHLKQWERRGAIPLRTIRRGKHEATTEGGREFWQTVAAGRRVGGIEYRNLAVAGHVHHLRSDLFSGRVTQFFREVSLDRPGKEPFVFDFLILERDPWAGVGAVFALHRQANRLDGIPSGRVRDWCPFPIHLFVTQGDRTDVTYLWDQDAATLPLPGVN